jgi:hypothetical protein
MRTHTPGGGAPPAAVPFDLTPLRPGLSLTAPPRV